MFLLFACRMALPVREPICAPCSPTLAFRPVCPLWLSLARCQPPFPSRLYPFTRPLPSLLFHHLPLSQLFSHPSLLVWALSNATRKLQLGIILLVHTFSSGYQFSSSSSFNSVLIPSLSISK